MWQLLHVQFCVFSLLAVLIIACQGQVKCSITSHKPFMFIVFIVLSRPKVVYKNKDLLQVNNTCWNVLH